MNQVSVATGRASTATVAPPMTSAQTDFLSQLAVHLGMLPSDGASLAAPRLFTGPAGLACRLHLLLGEPAVRPEALLPMSAQELEGPEIHRLLSLQSLVLSELGWYLGTSGEGLLQLSSLAWIDDPQDAATALDLANGVGIAVLHALLNDEAIAPSADRIAH
jgi:hypothetical protein